MSEAVENALFTSYGGQAPGHVLLRLHSVEPDETLQEYKPESTEVSEHYCEDQRHQGDEHLAVEPHIYTLSDDDILMMPAALQIYSAELQNYTLSASLYCLFGKYHTVLQLINRFFYNLH